MAWFILVNENLQVCPDLNCAFIFNRGISSAGLDFRNSFERTVSSRSKPPSAQQRNSPRRALGSRVNAECAGTAQCVEVALVTCNWVLEKHLLSVISMFIVNVVNGQRD